MNLLLFPQPRSYVPAQGSFKLKTGDYIVIEESDKDELFGIARELKQYIHAHTQLTLSVHVVHFRFQTGFTGHIVFERNGTLEKEEYKLTIAPACIRIEYASKSGAFYAVCTLKQIIQQRGASLHALHIHDKPVFPIRGFMLDISRNKMPTLDTLLQVVDLMADVKLNHLQLYFEGVSFAAPSYAEHWRDTSPFTAEEAVALDMYCRSKCIELAPMLNTFGHQEGWLSKRAFNHLADCPDGYTAPWGYQKPNTFNPLDAGTIDFFTTQIDELAPHFSSNYFNACCDETFELGLGKSKAECEKLGTGQVYLNYILKIYEILGRRGKTMMLANDIILKYEQLIPGLPKDIVILEWGYEADHPFEKECELFRKAGIPFIMMPGCSGWNSIAGRMENMQHNLRRAAECGQAYGAVGMLNSEFGDNGHWQNLPVSFPGLACGAAVSWNPEANKEADVAAFLDRFVFKDSNGKMGEFVMQLGNYYLLESERVHNNTLLAKLLYADLFDLGALHSMNERHFSNIERYVNKLEREGLDRSRMACADADLIVEEYKHALMFIRHAIDLGRIKLLMREGLRAKTKLIARLEEAAADLAALIHSHMLLWTRRNRMAGLSDSLRKLERLKSQYEDYIVQLNERKPDIPLLENTNHF